MLVCALNTRVLESATQAVLDTTNTFSARWILPLIPSMLVYEILVQWSQTQIALPHKNL